MTRRPGTAEDLATALALAPATVAARLHALVNAGFLQAARRERGDLYWPVND